MRRGGWSVEIRRFLLGAVVAAAAAAATGCAGRAPVPLRPEPRPYADTLPVEEPAVAPGWGMNDVFRLATAGIGQGASLRKWVGEDQPAVNLTRFDDVVGSSWYEHRNGPDSTLAPGRVRRGPGTSRPDPSQGITVLAGKSAGVSPGLTVEDSRGRRYILKFDPAEHLYLTTSAEAIASRFYWAAGYHVPETILIAVDPEDLLVGEDAEVTTAEGAEPMTREDLERLLGETSALPDGRYLAVCSRFVPGTPKGPWYFRATRSDDPNDYYQHQHRRELRGLFVLSAWLNNVDTRFGNNLTSYVEPGYLKHYLIDFGSSLGSGAIRVHTPRDGTEHQVDFWESAGRLVTLGFHRAGWEDEEWSPIYPSLGWMPVESFEPGEWEPNWPNAAYHAMTAADGYWGAKLVGSFTDAQIRAAVSVGEYPRPAVPDTLVDILRYRRDRVVEYWYGKVTPVEDLRVEASPPGAPGGARGRDRDGEGALVVSFRDLGLAHGPWTAEGTRYRWRFRHEALGIRSEGTASGSTGSGRRRIRVDASWPADPPEDGTLDEREALARLSLTAQRPDGAGRPATVWLEWRGPETGYRVVGLRH